MDITMSYEEYKEIVSTLMNTMDMILQLEQYDKAYGEPLTSKGLILLPLKGKVKDLLAKS